jgi:general secretion pathway protein B
MSYILEALKKSEQERHRGRTPDLQALHSLLTPTVHKRRWWPLILSLVLLFNAALILIWRDWETARPEPAATNAAVATAPTTPKPMIAPPVLQAQVPRVPQQAVAAASAPTDTTSPATEMPAPVAPVQTQESRILALSDLPPEVRRGIPEMSFAVHLYSAKPSESMVSINGKMLKEGQEVSAGLKLEHITPDGMVFSYQGYTFKRGVF